MNDTPPPTLSADELAAYAGTDPEEVLLMSRMGFLEPDPEGRFQSGDAHRLRIIDAFRRSGMPLETLVTAERAGHITLDYYDQLHATPTPPSERTYAGLRAAVGARGDLLGQLIRALSLAEPEPDSHLSREDEEMLLELLDIVDSTAAPDLGLRVARLFGEGLRRSMEAILGVYGEAVQRVQGSMPGLPGREVNERFLAPWNRYARIAPTLSRWLTQRHLSDAIDAFTVTATERFLRDLGMSAPREEVPQAVAFVDLTGFTRLAAERGDERAASVALQFGQLAADVSAGHAGRLVKLLGDGALLRFDSSTEAVDATLELLAVLPESGLPMGHAGIDAGPILTRDGDVFGRTVNLAARLSDRAEPGWILLSSRAAEALPVDGRRYDLEPVGRERLAGFPEAIEIVRIVV